MGTLADNRAAALTWVNEMRAQWDMPPLDGLRPGACNSVNACSLGRSLESRVVFFNSGEYLPGPDPDEGNTLHLPYAVAVFEHDFERGFYPDLIMGQGPVAYYGRDGTAAPRSTAVDSPLALT